MATALDLSSLGNFDPYSDPTTLSLRWKEWLRRYERFLVAMDVKDDTRKRALLLYAAGNEVEKVFATFSDVGEDKDCKKAVEKLNEYFSPKKNVLFETHKFRQLKQVTEETIDQYCTRHRQRAIICEFSNMENEIKIQLLEGCLSSRVRRKAIQDDLSLADILSYARSLEITDKAVKTLEEDCGNLASHSSAVNAIHNQQEKSGQYQQQTNRHQPTTQYPTGNRYSYQSKNADQVKSREQQQDGKKLCYNCGENYNAGHLSVCRAKGKSCFACGKQNHFAAMCRSRQSTRNYFQNPKVLPEPKGENIRSITHTDKQPDSSDEDSYAFVVSPPVENRVSPTTQAVKTIPVIIEKAHIKMIVDTGVTTNILDAQAFNEIQKKNPPSYSPFSSPIPSV